MIKTKMESKLILQQLEENFFYKRALFWEMAI